MSTQAKPKTPDHAPRSVFKPIHPNPAATTSTDSPRKSGTPGLPPIVNPASVAVDLLVSVSSPGDKTTGLGRTFFFSSSQHPRAVSVVLNSSCGLILRALQRNDQSVLALALAILFVEFVNFRGQAKPYHRTPAKPTCTEVFPRPPTRRLVDVVESGSSIGGFVIRRKVAAVYLH